ncbi:MAG: ABC transporter permease subunit, partial [Pseudomonadota bacterium]|nr:ABC transporter permease subunit [Pseudomonadota bacterium]
MKMSFRFSGVMFWLGMAFLYLPMLSLIVYSFNESRLVTVWAGWSTKWYGELFRDEGLMMAVWRSLEVAFWSANTAVLLGVMASVALTRFGRFRGRSQLHSLVAAPLVMPDVIIGLSLLLLFVSMTDMIGWPQQRGLLTIWIAHATFCTAYATVVISSRLKELDRSYLEAAMDLGATPLKAFIQVTLPII